jgi:CysZ protein
MTPFMSGADYFLRAWKLIIKPSVFPYFIIPALINFTIFALMFWIGGHFFNDFVDYLLTFLPDWLQWLSNVLWIMFAVQAGLFMFLTFSFFTNLVGAPFNKALAIAVEKYLGGATLPNEDYSPWSEYNPVFIGEAKKWLIFLIAAIILLLISYPLAFIAPFLWLAFAAWLYGLEYLEYPFSNHGLGFSASRKKISSKRFLALGFGMAVTVGTLIPFVNFIVMPVAVIGATLMRSDQYPLQTIENSVENTET